MKTFLALLLAISLVYNFYLVSEYNKLDQELVLEKAAHLKALLEVNKEKIDHIKSLDKQNKFLKELQVKYGKDN